jgi:site-specific recombinase XerC
LRIRHKPAIPHHQQNCRKSILKRLGHEQIATTNIYLHADMTHKQQAIDRTKPLATKPGRYRPPDSLLAFLEAL